MDGASLRLLRLARRVTVVGIARAYGVAPTRISAIEGSIEPTVRAVERYLAALEVATVERRSTGPNVEGARFELLLPCGPRSPIDG